MVTDQPHSSYTTTPFPRGTSLRHRETYQHLKTGRAEMGREPCRLDVNTLRTLGVLRWPCGVVGHRNSV